MAVNLIKAYVQDTSAATTYLVGMIDHMITVVGQTYGLDYIDYPNADDLWVAAMRLAA